MKLVTDNGGKEGYVLWSSMFDHGPETREDPMVEALVNDGSYWSSKGRLVLKMVR